MPSFNSPFLPLPFVPILTVPAIVIAGFAKILQESKQATLVGLGGLWHLPMDVASFAGGFVCNPTLLNNIAGTFNSTFPQFQTTARWQFDWAVSLKKKKK